MRVTHSLLHADDLAQLVEREYAIAAPVKVSLLNRGFSDTYLVTDVEGDRRVLRVYNRESTGSVRSPTSALNSTCSNTWPRPGWASSARTSGPSATGSAG